MKRSSFTLAQLWALAVVVGVFAFVNTHPIRPHDFWWHIAVGREIVATHRIPTVDTFSYTMRGAPYPSYQAFWLMEVWLYLLYRAGGAALVVLAQALTLTATYALVLLASRLEGGSWRLAAFAALFAVALGLDDWNVRPQVAAFLIAALFLWALTRLRHGGSSRLLLLFPPGMALWVNVHGTFPLGAGLLGLGWLDAAWEGWRSAGWKGLLQRSRPFLLAMVASIAALLLCNPRGVGIVAYLRTLTTDPAVQHLVPEWAPPTFQTWSGALFLLALLFVAAVLALSPQRPRPSELAGFLAFGLLALKTSRGVIWFGLVMAPVLAHHLAALLARLPKPAERDEGESPLLNRLMAALLLGGACLSLPWFKPLLPLPPEKAALISPETPVAATEALLRDHPPGPLFHAMPFGSYLIWAAQPDYPVFVDSRIELYPLEVWLDYLRISAAECDWEARLAHYGVRTLMLSPQEQPALVEAARASPHWRELYADEAAVIFVRAD